MAGFISYTLSIGKDFLTPVSTAWFGRKDGQLTIGEAGDPGEARPENARPDEFDRIQAWLAAGGEGVYVVGEGPVGEHSIPHPSSTLATQMLRALEAAREFMNANATTHASVWKRSDENDARFYDRVRAMLSDAIANAHLGGVQA